MSLARHLFHMECEADINKQINLRLHASYVYLSMSWYFDRDDVALPGMKKLFKKHSDEKREDAEAMMKYQNMRGGRIVLQNVEKPERDMWGSAVEAMQAAVEMEKNVNKTMHDLHAVAEMHHDAQMCDWIEGNFLHKSVEHIKTLATHATSLRRAGPGLGEHVLDREHLS